MTGETFLAAISALNTLIGALIWFRIGKMEGQLTSLERLEYRVSRLENRAFGDKAA